VAERAAVNASPLIHLARGGLIRLLEQTGSAVVVPDAVARELRVRDANDPAVLAIEREPWIEVVPSPPIPTSVQAWDLGAGESSVLAWVLEHGRAEAIVDDLAARRCAAALGIPVRGTLGLVLLAKQRGTIERARPLLEALREGGMYLADAVLDRALRLVDE
jgi:predicted nucleic acid-binding protein